MRIIFFIFYIIILIEILLICLHKPIYNEYNEYYGNKTYNFIHIPKNAGESIQKLINNTKDLPINYIFHGYPRKMSNEIVILREPIDRFISAFYYRKQKYYEKNKVDFDKIKTPNDFAISLYTKNSNYKNALNIWKQQDGNHHKILGNEINCNWVFAPQYLYFNNPKYVLRFENLDNEFKMCLKDIGYNKNLNIPKKNYTNSIKKDKYLSDIALKFIHEYYQEDFKLLKNVTFTY